MQCSIATLSKGCTDYSLKVIYYLDLSISLIYLMNAAHTYKCTLIL